MLTLFGVGVVVLGLVARPLNRLRVTVLVAVAGAALGVVLWRIGRVGGRRALEAPARGLRSGAIQRLGV